MRRGLFVTLEGPEGSGKSSQAKALAKALRRAGRAVVVVNDPGSTRLGRRLRRVLLHDAVSSPSPLAEALLFIAGRIQLVHELILPALRRGAIVVCDRFHDSTIAYQGYGGQLDVAWLEQLGRAAIGGVMPHVTVLLDVPTPAGFARLAGSRDRMERKPQAFHRRVRQGYLKMARSQRQRIIVLDGTQPKALVHRRILGIVLGRLS